MDTNVLAKQIVNEVESSYLSLTSAYDLDTIEQLDFLELIRNSIDIKLRMLKQEIVSENNLVYCYGCNKYHRIDECERKREQEKYERRSILTMKGKEARWEIVKKYEEFLLCPEKYIIECKWDEEYVDRNKQKDLEEQWNKQMQEELSRVVINEESKNDEEFKKIIEDCKKL